MRVSRMAVWATPVLLWCSCSQTQEQRKDHLMSHPAMADSYTCVVNDTSCGALLLGSPHAHFSLFNPTDSTLECLPLPAESADRKTYDIFPLSSLEYLVAKQNFGLTYVRYTFDSEGHRRLEHSAGVKLPSSPLPDKGRNFSVYSMLRRDSTIVLATSNGLAYLDHGTLASLRRDSMATARFCAPIVHLRKSKPQFAQEAIFAVGDSIISVTDHGIYGISIKDFDNPDASYRTFDHEMRCWDAEIRGDSIVVLWSPGEDPEQKLTTTFALSGTRGRTLPAPSSTMRIRLYGDSLLHLTDEGDFTTFRSSATRGDMFYYIKDGALRCSDTKKPSDYADEKIRHYDRGYALSNLNGIWKIQDTSPLFLGSLTGVSGIRDISVSGGKMYVATDAGVYCADLTNRIFPYDRKASLVEPNRHKSSDKAVCVFARGDTLLIGSRNGLHSILTKTGQTRHYSFPALDKSYESPYILDILPASGHSWLLQTLNHGVWQLDSLQAPDTHPTEIRMTTPDPSASAPLIRPMLTWRKIADHLLTILSTAMAIIAAVFITLTIIQLRHKRKIRILNLAVADEHRAYQEQKRLLEKSRADLHKRHDELNRLHRKIEGDKRIAAKEMGLPLKTMSDALTKNISSLTPAPLSEWFAIYLKPITAYLDLENPEPKEIALATDAYRNLSKFCTDVITSASALAEDIPDKGVMREPMLKYREEYMRMNEIPASTISVRLDRVVAIYRLLDVLCDQISQNLASILSENGCHVPDFTSEGIAALWNDCILPATRKTAKYSISRQNLVTEKDIVVRKRTYIFTTFTFFGCSDPRIDGAEIEIDKRSITRLDNSGLGTIFKFWANQLSATCFDYGAVGMPSSIADLLWRVWLSKPEAGLSQGIRLAYARLHHLPITADIDPAPNTRRKGRPSKPERHS